ncbi:serine protease [Streptomyces sp. RKND-216]|uniref:S8 family serine peptidase n=1 Tax=Streptomyces sp. RKND-216 TaxID=2562581 RepID=UPI00109D9D5A|nr:S8 family serine peptidase [Streptomyces sp. RKND-216]THA24214.1 serine protease [Streptomyces sp. RKND-216]
MKLRRALHLVGAGALTGALLLGSAPTAAADDIRDRQWALGAFAAEEIWEHSTGKGVTVAVVDTGVDVSHPDLRANVLEGRDFSPGGEEDARKDTSGHGTSMASLIAGQGHGSDGSAGVKGLAPGAQILPVKFQDHESQTGVSFHDGIRYAVDQGADVISISQGTSEDSRDLRAIEYAIENDVIVVASTGNDGKKRKEFPAAYPGVVSVGGVDTSGGVWERSSWGSNTTLIAPAEGNVVADPKSASGYAMQDGTSNATAFVAAAAALVIAEHPDITAGQVINRLIKTAKVPHGENANAQLPDEKFGYGIVRPLRAVTHDIPAGPKEGPLAKSSEGETSTSTGSDDSQAAPGDDSTASEESSGLGGVLIGVIAVAALVVLGLVVYLAMRGKRKNAQPFAGAPGPGPANGWSGVPPQQFGQQRPPQAGQYYGPPASPPLPPNQPPSPR